MSSNDLAAPVSVTVLKPYETLVARYRRALHTTPDQLTDALLRRIHYELDLPADERQRAILDRLRAWLALDREEAQRLAISFDNALRLVSTDEKSELRESERDAALNALTFQEFEQLAGLVSAPNERRADDEWSVLPWASLYAFIAAATCGASV